MNVPSHSPAADVLVIGAGPVGLFLANLLGRSGTTTLLLEKRLAETAAPSMAIGIMPPSLSLFESIALADPLVRAGCAVRSAVVHDQTSTLGRLDFSTLPAPFPFILSIPQGELMRLLRERLADYSTVRFMEGCEAIGLRQDTSSATVQVRDVRDGTCKEWTAAYVVACDGRNSSLRRALGVPMTEKHYPVSFVMGDFPDTTPWQNEAHLFFTPNGSVESFPLPRERRRWVALADGQKWDTEALVQRVRSITGIGLNPGAELWHSSFTPERRVARTFFRERVALCGDAAHVMSPIGGQGMNVGFADAWHLAAVMRHVLQTREPHAPLFARYQADRRRASRVAANRAACGMWLGTRTGRIPSAVRSCVIRHALLRFPLSRHLSRHFAMLTLPRESDPIPLPSTRDALP
jgi:2-polyprenyl-6-methoxyphenol hydroxylase-like FAD-dependent oxidoreductase